MSRVDDRIRARLQMQVVLRAIGVLAVVVGVALVLVWFVGPVLEAIAHSRSSLRPSLGWELRDGIGWLSLGLCAIVPGATLLMMTDWLAQRWVPIREHAICPECDYPRDDMERKTCLDCGHEFYRKRATASNAPSDVYRAEG